ncbi:hypothetical protein Nepgr_003621 [Nepenthes gracilis]|uniref:WRKY domain-containing protein n=1 Tax=Nepenthes gracilis TaxID=150966 RepID=A0AAD3XDY5_NEPGR|nr:hypothetical protein Nepgr_003621 [Nepenthes gracilis]
MDDPDKPDPATELNELSCWTLGPDSEDNDYFFGSDRESTILGEFGWNYSSSELEPTLEPGHFTCTDRVKADDEPSDMVAASSSSQLPANAAFQRLYSAAPSVVTAEASTTATSNPSVSSSSSEDLPEKSTVSGGGKPGETSTKVKKKGQKRIRQQRFAFMTKSEVDHLEDGYRWRKYGQKAVKNSPFPRSYYRCTNSKCTVKKRVERSSENPTVVHLAANLLLRLCKTITKECSLTGRVRLVLLNLNKFLMVKRKGHFLSILPWPPGCLLMMGFLGTLCPMGCGTYDMDFSADRSNTIHIPYFEVKCRLCTPCRSSLLHACTQHLEALH